MLRYVTLRYVTLCYVMLCYVKENKKKLNTTSTVILSLRRIEKIITLAIYIFSVSSHLIFSRYEYNLYYKPRK